MDLTKIVIIYNPKAGSFQAGIGRIQQLVAALKSHNLEIEDSQVQPTKAAGDATRLSLEAVANNTNLVIACGGDGTINEIAQALVGTKTVLAVLPGGTANVMAKELQLSTDPNELAKLISLKRSRVISVGRASKPDKTWSRYFLLMAGIGLDASIIETVDPALKKQWGLGSYVAAGLKTLATWPLKPFTITFNDEEHEATFAIVANAANYAAWFNIAPEARMETDHLNICVFNSRSRLVYLSYAFLSLFGAHTISPAVIHKPILSTYANTSIDTPVQLDGELVGHLPMLFECVPQSLHIIA